MNQRVTIKDHFREVEIFTNRIIVAVVCIVIVVTALVSRMVYLQVFQHEMYTSLSQANRYNLMPVAPNRGFILDRNGVVLAQNQAAFSLELIPEKVKDIKGTIARLREVIEISSVDQQQFERIKRQTPPSRGVPLRTHLNEEEVAAFAVRRWMFPGVDIQPRLSRHYPLGAMAVHALGYVGRISEDELKDIDQTQYNGTTHMGKIGVEKAYESALHGNVGLRKVETNAFGRILRVLEDQPANSGKNLILNIDIGVQSVAETSMGDIKGAVVALDPKTGGVIALAGMPGYDPNNFVNGIDAGTYRYLSKSPDRPLYNRAIKGRYPPGSTIKPFMALAGLAYGEITPEKTISCRGSYSLKGDSHRYRDWKKEGHGTVNMETAIRESCDVYFYDLAHKLEIDRISAFLTKFGFGSFTGIDVQGETQGVRPSREWKRKAKKEAWYPGETLSVGIGQGYHAVSPLQMAVATATIATRGVRAQPHLGYALQDPKSGALELIEPTFAKAITDIPPENWERVIEGMRQVVHSPRGTAFGISKNLPYTIAGKTGTAQVFSLKQGEKYEESKVTKELRDHAWFMAFAPIDDPKIAVVIIAENAGHGGSVAAPMVRKIMDSYLLKEKP